jgi:predicted permease
MATIGFILFKNKPKQTKGIILMTLVGFNVAHFSFPIIEGIWGKEGMQYIALVDIGNAFTIFVLCYIIGSIYAPSNNNEANKVNLKYILTRLIYSTSLMSYIFALIINLSNVMIPIFLVDLVDIIARANSALSLLLLGIYLNFKFQKEEWNTIIKVLLTRYSIGLIVGLLLFFFLPVNYFVLLFRIIITISLVLPVGLAVIPFAVEFEYNHKLVSIITNLTIIISFCLVWILILLLSG